MTAQAIASKFRRAIRNKTGATFTSDQMLELASYGVLKALAEIELRCNWHDLSNRRSLTAWRP